MQHFNTYHQDDNKIILHQRVSQPIVSQNQIANNNSTQNQPKTFKIQENEIYMIKESSIKRSNDILKKSIISKPSFKSIIINKKQEENNQKLKESLLSTEQLFCSLSKIKETQEYFDNKMDFKFKEWQEFQSKINNNEQKQKEMNASYNLLKSVLNN